MIGNVSILTYLSKTGRRHTTLVKPFFTEDEYQEILKGAFAVFGKPDKTEVRRDVDLSLEGIGGGVTGLKVSGKDLKNGLSPL